MSSEDGAVPGDEYRVFTVERTWRLARLIGQWPIGRRIRVYGQERVPPAGGAVLACNHIAGADIVLIAAAQPRVIRYMAKAELFTYNRAFATVIRHGGAFPVRRGESDRDALRTARALVRTGSLLGVFAEGTRQEREEIGELKPGAALIASLENVPIVPCVIQGSIHLKERLDAAVTVVFGEPIAPDVVSGAGRVERLTALLYEEMVSLQRFSQAALRAGRPERALPPESTVVRGVA